MSVGLFYSLRCQCVPRPYETNGYSGVQAWREFCISLKNPFFTSNSTNRRINGDSQMKLKSVLRTVTVCVFGVAFGGRLLATPVTTIESFGFDNNQLPTGWSTWTNTSPGKNISIQNGRFLVGQVDSTGGISRSFSPTGVQSVKIEYDANVANVYWGMGTAAGLLTNLSNFDSGSAYVNLAKAGYGTNSMNSGIAFDPAVGPGVLYYNKVSSPAVFGDYHIAGTFQDGQISLSVVNNATQQSFVDTVAQAPGFLLSQMNNVLLWAATTTGPSAYIDNVKITTTQIAPTCTPPQVLQNGACVAPVPAMVGALPEPGKFTGQVLPFATANFDLLKSIAKSNGDDNFQVAGSTQRLLNPSSTNYLYDNANAVANRLDQFAQGLDAITTYADGAVVLSTGGVGGAIKEFTKSLATSLGFGVADAVLQEKGGSVGQRVALTAELMSAMDNCVQALAGAVAVNLGLCSAKVISFDISKGLVPLLQRYAIDPPNPNYLTVVTVDIPSITNGPESLRPTINALIRAQAYLQAINETYDRYVTAYNAGDTDSALLQLQAYIKFFGQYNDNMLIAKIGLGDILAAIKGDPGLNFSPSDVAELLAQVKQGVAMNGLDSDIIAILQGMGLDGDQILQVQDDIINFQYTPDGNLSDEFSKLVAEFNIISVANEVPAPGTLPLLLLALSLAGILSWKNLRSHSAR